MQFCYRYVPFGTSFESCSGLRGQSAAPSQLFENEIATDVGGFCLEYDSFEHAVIDHHFSRADGGQFPSAAAAVVHLADAIHQRFRRRKDFPVVWLVTHQQPDFDAYASLYLVRKLLEDEMPPDGWAQQGLRRDGWFGGSDPGEINWFDPTRVLAGLNDNGRRWPLLLASAAAYVDHGRTFGCPLHRTLHSVLYAAILRGRPLQDSGALAYFDEVRKRLTETTPALNPLVDSVLEGSEEFAPELALLDRQPELYRRDLARAHKTIVNVRRSKQKFHQWFTQSSQRKLLCSAAEPTIDPAHIDLSQHDIDQVDALFLRDPECFLFKQWARADRENSSMNQGFVFTGIAYSGGRGAGQVNSTDYWFSLDPERAGRRHLYNVWMALQAKEVAAALLANGESSGGNCRPGYQARAGEFAKQFADPWFDAPNYLATLVATPAGGSRIGPPGIRDDLSDDPIANLVLAELDSAWFAGDVITTDYNAATDRRQPRKHKHQTYVQAVGELKQIEAGRIRFCAVPLREDVNLLAGDVSLQIGLSLLQLVNSPGTDPPPDFRERHLIFDSTSACVWTRNGVVVAYKSAAADDTGRMDAFLAQIADISRRFADIYSRAESNVHDPQMLHDAEHLLREVIKLKQEIADPTMRPLSRLFLARRLDESLQMLFELSHSTSSRDNLHTIASVQKVVHVIEYVVLPYYFAHIFEFLAGHKESADAHAEASGLDWLFGWPLRAVLLLAGVVVVELINVAVEGETLVIGRNSLLARWRRKARKNGNPGDNPVARHRLSRPDGNAQ